MTTETKVDLLDRLRELYPQLPPLMRLYATARLFLMVLDCRIYRLTRRRR